MITKVRCSAGVLACALALVIGTPSSAAAQTDTAAFAKGPPWGIFNAVGYGALGFGLGALTAVATTDDYGPGDIGLIAIGAGTIAGVLGGATIGNRARRAEAQGESISAGHRMAVAGGVVLAGVTLGALAAIPLINNEGSGTALGSDERTFAVLSAAGAGLGILYLIVQRDHLVHTRVQAVPVIRERGQYALHVRFRSTRL